VVHEFLTDEALQGNLKKKLIKVYKEMLPFRRYLNQAVTV